jgi:hypothetical protein
MLWLAAAAASHIAERGEAAAAGNGVGLPADGQVVVDADCAGAGGVVTCDECLNVAIDTEPATARRVHTDRGR